MFSIIMPLEKDRLDLAQKTLDKYFELKFLPKGLEFIFVSRTLDETDVHNLVPIPSLRQLILYEHNGEYFNPAKALNLGVKAARNDRIIITCPEVMPITNVLRQLSKTKGNVLCQVFDTNKDNSRSMSLVNEAFRSNNPGMYFLACFDYEDIEDINGWDEDFMKGYAYEDNDFGNRFARAGKTFIMADGIIGEHQWHPRLSSACKGYSINHQKFVDNNNNEVIRPKNGLEKLK